MPARVPKREQATVERAAAIEKAEVKWPSGEKAAGEKLSGKESERRSERPAAPPKVQVVDTVGAGDTFTAALTVALIEGKSPQDALAFAVTAGALACTRPGAQPSLPHRRDVDALALGGK